MEANTVHLYTRITAANFNDFAMSYLQTYYLEWRRNDFLYFLFHFKSRFLAVRVIETAAIDELADPSSGLSRWSAAARGFGSRVRIPFIVWMFVSCVFCCVGSGLWD